MADKTVKVNDVQAAYVRQGLLVLKKQQERAIVKYQSEGKIVFAEMLRGDVASIAAVLMMF